MTLREMMDGSLPDKERTPRINERMYQCVTFSVLGITAVVTPQGEDYLEWIQSIEHKQLGLQDDSKMHQRLGEHYETTEEYDTLLYEALPSKLSVGEIRDYEETLERMSGDTELPHAIRVTAGAVGEASEKVGGLHGEYDKSEVTKDLVAIVREANRSHVESIRDQPFTDNAVDAVAPILPLAVAAYGVGKLIDAYSSEIRNVCMKGREKVVNAYRGIVE